MVIGLKPHLHELKNRHGSPNFWHRANDFKARHPQFSRCKATCAFAANNHFSFRLFFLFRQDVGQFSCWTKGDYPCFDFSHILLLRCDARWRQALYPPFPGNKTDEEKGCRLNIGTVPSWRETFYFRSCKWVVPCRNCLGNFGVPCRFFSACKLSPIYTR